MARPKTALITGVTGFVGSALARRLRAESVHVTGLVRRQSRRPRVDALSGIELIEVEDHQRTTMLRVLRDVRPDVVYHLAAAGVARLDCDVDELLHTNVELACHLTQAIAQAGRATLIHVGSCFEYGGAAAAERISEDAALRPFSVYGATKAAAGMLVHALARQEGLDLVALRLFGMYGPGEAPQRLAPYIIQQLHRNEPVELTSGLQVRDLLYVDDAVEALWMAAQGGDALRGQHTFNVCSGRPVSVRDVGRLLAELMNRSDSLLHWGARPPRGEEPDRIVGDPRRFMHATRWKPSIALRTGLQLTVDHWLALRRKSNPAAA